ncbi:hypothetical protein N7537_009225 [Penicillium hordei]|uniref:Uncharacterized protein n=1 Tax=Penicillium hordei TaxID=40994 RepID=A0AAD6GUK9_9EURO|nr:uncharacterized protein N7537_009225 [Penicillium hordei]KAJ5592321.1 hypothetical protein N7537_009225 [Penicillium hordei]
MSQSPSSTIKQKVKGWLGVGKTDGEMIPKNLPLLPRVQSGNVQVASISAYLKDSLAFERPILIQNPPTYLRVPGVLGYRTPPKEKIDRYQATGAQFEDWMANTNSAGPACPVVQSRLTLAALVDCSPPERPEFDVWKSEFVVPPAEIRGCLESTGLPRNERSKDYRYSHLHRNGNLMGVPTYEHCMVEGAIIVKAVFRRKQGPQWTDIALALYKHDAAIDTLRYVYYTTVENKETQPLVGKVLYPNNNLPGLGNRAGATIQTWHMHTPEFQQILGTKLGRATARLVLAAWPRGTHEIPRINTWFWSGNLHMRFDIEPVARVGHRPSRPPLPTSPTTPTPPSRHSHR